MSPQNSRCSCRFVAAIRSGRNRRSLYFFGLTLLTSSLADGAQTNVVRRVREAPLPKFSVSAAAVSSDPLGVSREIWISLRTDNLAGDGTQANPFNGSGPRFDAKLSEMTFTTSASNLIIRLMPGTFETRGYPTWYPLNGWKIRGAGMDITTVRLVGASNNVFGVIASPYGIWSGVEVADLTVDCNDSPTNPNGAHAVAISGSGGVIRRVKAINGNNPPGEEAFPLGVFGGPGTLTDRCLIEECEVSSFRGNYCTAIGIGGVGQGFYNSSRMQGVVRRNRVYDVHNRDGRSLCHAYGGAIGLQDSLYEENYSIGCDIGFNGDTGRMRNLTLRNNR